MSSSIRVSAEVDDEDVQISIDGQSAYVLRHYDDFYGLYWATRLSPTEFVANIVVPLQYFSTMQRKYLDKPPIHDIDEVILYRKFLATSILQQTHSEEFELNRAETFQLVNEVKNNEDKNILLSEYFNNNQTNLLPEDTTFIRINTRLFNSSWERIGSQPDFGLLSHLQLPASMARFCIDTLIDFELDEKDLEEAKRQLSDIFSEHTSGYKGEEE